MPSEDETGHAVPRVVSSASRDMVPAHALLRKRRLDVVERDGHLESQDIVFCPRQARSIPPQECDGCDARRSRTQAGDIVCDVPSVPPPAPSAVELSAIGRGVMVGAIMDGVTCVRDFTLIGQFLGLHPQHDFAVAIDRERLPVGVIWSAAPLPRGSLARRAVPIVELAQPIGVVAEAASLTYALRVMARTHARQLCVVGGGGVVVGALSDIAALQTLIALRRRREL